MKREISIRNFCILSHVDHGKTTLSDHLISAGGLLPEHLAGGLRALDFLDAEQERGITIDASIASFSIIRKETILKINLVDTPGHVDFGLKTREAMRLVDNGLIVVDAVEGVLSQTRNVVQLAIKEDLNLVVYINKIDRLINELEFNQNQIRERIERIIGEISHFCLSFDYVGEIPSFENGKVLIGSAIDGWAYDIISASDIGQFNQIYSWYEGEKVKYSENAKLKDVFSRVIQNKFVGPERLKNLRLRNWGNLRPVLTTIIVGQRFRISRDVKFGNLTRILSGSISIGHEIYSYSLQRYITILKIIEFKGRRQKNVDTATEGDIVGLEFNSYPITGDVLTTVKQNIKLPISKSLDQVVRRSLEPTNLEDLDKLKSILTDLQELNPGISFVESEETGELIVSGMGTLQLELILEDIEKLEVSVVSSAPSEIVILQPKSEIQDHFQGANFLLTNLSLHSINKEDENKEKNGNLIFVTNFELNEFEEGFEKSVIEQLKNLYSAYYLIQNVLLKLEFELKPENRYEAGLVLGTKFVRHLANQDVFGLYYPYYVIRIHTVANYIGQIVNLIQQHSGEITSISEGSESTILGEIGILQAYELSDKLRRVTDGYVSWSFDRTIYKMK